MTLLRRIVPFALVALLLVALGSPALAGGEEHSETGDATETTVAEVPFAGGEPPAVVIPPVEPEETEQPWTARFLIPLLVVTAIVLVIGVAIAYNHQIRTRYKVST